MRSPVHWRVGVAVLIALAVAGCSDRNQFELIPQDKMPPNETQVWDGRVENVIYIKYLPWDEVFAFHFFEDLIVPAPEWPAKHFNNNRRLDEKLFKWTEDGAGRMRFSLDQQEVVPFKLDGRLWTEGNTVRVEGDIVNRGKIAWTPDSAAALMCFRAHLVKEFHDTQGTRIWLTKKDGSGRVSVFDLIGMDPKIYPFFNFFCWQKDSPYAPKIAKENDKSSRRIVFESTPAQALGGNRLDYMSCIHANYALEAAPGAASHFSSTITFEDIAEPSR